MTEIPLEGRPADAPDDAPAAPLPVTIRLVRKHPLAIRWMHWINFPILCTMIWSGLYIYYMDADRGPNGMIHQGQTFRIGFGSLTLVRLFPDWFWRLLDANEPKMPRALGYHFLFMWFFVFNGAAYVLYTLLSGEWRALLPDRRSLREARDVVAYDLGLSKIRPAHGKYNAAQRIFLRPEDLTGKQRGLQTYQAQMNFPNPWRGGWWRLRDIVDYELDAAFGFLDAASRYKNTLLFNAYRMNRDAVERGKKEGPYAFVIPAGGVEDKAWKNDPWTVRVLAETLLLAGVELHRARTPFTSDGVTYPAGSLVVLMAQPLRPYAKDLLETQAYPDRELYPGGPPEPPYDEAAWSLPLKMGLRVLPVAQAFDAALDPLTQADLPEGRIVDGRGATTLAFSAESNAATIAVNRLLKLGAEVIWTQDPVRTGQGELPAHSFAVTIKGPGAKASASAVADAGAGAGSGSGVKADASLDGVSRTLEELSLTAYGVKGSAPRGPAMRAPRVGLYQAWGGHMDEGWTRLVFEKFEVPFTTLHNADIKAGDLNTKFDVIVLPAASGTLLLTGEYSARAKTPTLPPPYAGGIGTDGVANLLKFVRAGGTVVALDEASEFAIEQFGLPVKNVLAGKKSEEFFCPGSILDVDIDQRSFITAGLPPTAGVFFNASPAFEVQTRFGEAAPVTLAAYGPSNPLRSGWLRGEALLHNRGALVDVPTGKGRVVLIGFRTQFRAQTYGTFRILFNSLFASALQPAPTIPPAPALTSAPGR